MPELSPPWLSDCWICLYSRWYPFSPSRRRVCLSTSLHTFDLRRPSGRQYLCTSVNSAKKNAAASVSPAVTLNEMPNPFRRQLQTPPNCGDLPSGFNKNGWSSNRELCFLISLINQNLGLISKHRGVTSQNYGSTIWQSSMTGYLEYQTYIIEYIVIYYTYNYIIIKQKIMHNKKYNISYGMLTDFLVGMH